MTPASLGTLTFLKWAGKVWNVSDIGPIRSQASRERLQGSGISDRCGGQVRRCGSIADLGLRPGDRIVRITGMQPGHARCHITAIGVEIDLSAAQVSSYVRSRRMGGDLAFRSSSLFNGMMSAEQLRFCFVKQNRPSRRA